MIRAAWAGLRPSAVGHLSSCEAPAPTAAMLGGVDDTAVFAPAGRVVEIQAIGRDVTERKARRAGAA